MLLISVLEPPGLHYWSVSSENEPPQRPIWYHGGTKASSIEATAYGLLVFAHQAQAQVDNMEEYDYEDEGMEALQWDFSLDSIASWLIQKRNSHGAFIGAMVGRVASLLTCMHVCLLIEKKKSRGVFIRAMLGGFCLSCEDFGGSFEASFPSCASCMCMCVCVCIVDISSGTPILLFRPGSVQSGSAS